MSKLIGRLLVVLAFGWAWSASAHAILITGSPISESSLKEDKIINDFIWNFNSLPSGVGLASLLLNYERLDTEHAYEYLDVFLDDVFLGDTFSVSARNCVNGTDITFGRFGGDCNASISFSFDTALLSDGLLNVRVASNKLSAFTVNSLIDDTLGAGFAKIAISYQEEGQVPTSYQEEGQVPTPATLPLLGIGLAALGYSRRKRNLQS